MDLICWVIAVAAVVYGYGMYRLYKSNSKKVEEYEEDLKEQASEIQTQNKLINELKEQVIFLKKYQGVADAKAEEEKIKAEVQRFLLTAKKQSQLIIQHANNVSSEALDAKSKLLDYKKLTQAIKNIINGYGDQYIIPNHSVLDNLAEEMDHKEAGAKLKKFRAITRKMVKDGEAADCDYSDDNQRSKAIKFVLDAFNGKVDSVLSTVKHNNYGKIKQEIEDGFRLINHHGEAFQNARIRSEYLIARLQELRWAVAAQELKLQEREEQRRIKETMREEEKARREYEKALKQAEDEEKTLQRQMRELQERQRLEAVNEQQRAEFETQLAELQQQLTDTEERNQRALSMAQQTRQGHIYVISNVGSFGSDVFKIGMTRRLDPMLRVKELGDASVPFEFDIHAMIHSADAPALEKELHRRFDDFQVNKVNPRKEFFKVTLADIRKVVEDMEIEAHWTMTAEAVQYRESLALMKGLHQDAEEMVTVH